MQLRLGLADIGTAARQFGRHAHRHLRRHRRDRLALGQLGPQGVRRFRDQQTERVDQLRLLLLLLRQLGCRGGDLCGGVGDIEIGGQPTGGALRASGAGSGFDESRFSCEIWMSRCTPRQLDVVARDFGQHAEQ